MNRTVLFVMIPFIIVAVVMMLLQRALSVLFVLLPFIIVAVGLMFLTRTPLYDGFASQRLYDIPTSWKDICRDGFKETITPGGNPDGSNLSPDAANASYLPLSLREMPHGEALNNWGAMTSQRCLSLDQSEALRPANARTNLLQRTNNYPRVHPDSCSAPNHEFVSTFYSPAGAIQATPLSGTTYPPSTQCR